MSKLHVKYPKALSSIPKWRQNGTDRRKDPTGTFIGGYEKS